jgi:dimethylamine---corrinoid protein Co-methyltransferase
VGVGDPLGMACSHALASGMGGMRTAGDLVARMQMTRGMRLDQAKKYVAGKLGVSPAELSDPLVMHEVRRDFGLGLIPVQELTYPSEPGAMEAKFHISEVFDVPINSVQKFSEHIARSHHDVAVSTGVAAPACAGVAAARTVGASTPRPEVSA